MPLDRALQRRILESCAARYPAMTAEVRSFADMPELAANIRYLEEHGLVEAILKISMDGQFVFGGVKATNKGMDFLAEDGGLSAILGVVTIKLHDDTFKRLVESKILEADLPPADKRRYIDQLRELPAETTKHLVLKLVDKGLEGGPQAMAWLGKWLAGL
jgi:hypothetical protein